jgi:hypothetical protein
VATRGLKSLLAKSIPSVFSAMAVHPVTSAICTASAISDIDMVCGFQSALSSGTSSSIYGCWRLPFLARLLKIQCIAWLIVFLRKGNIFH